jgi:hypothetical protein
MITFNQLGYSGKLGNQMFQYATLYGIAKKNGYDLCVPETNYDWKLIGDYNCKFYLPEIFNISAKGSDKRVEQKHNYEHTGHIFDPNALSLSDETDIAGYFQSEKYFSHCSEDIRKEFSFKNQKLYQEVSMHMKSLPTKIGVHVRRGDYVKKQHFHPLCHPEYYRAAINELTLDLNDFVLYVFSDDIEWCKQNFNSITNAKVIFDESGGDEQNYFQNQEKTLMKMTMCDRFIIANSSYSWWGAWLGKNEKVIAPRSWFAWMDESEYKDIYCDHWKII